MLFVIEGLDGCGKATQTALFAENLRKRGNSVQTVSFPMYKNDSSTLVQLYLNGKISADLNDVNPYAASMFYAADRYITFKQEWEKINKDSRNIIIADRYTTANQLYQATKQPAEKRIAFTDWVADFEYNKLGLPKPDFVIMLRIPVEISQQLMLKRYKGDTTKRDIHETDTQYLQHVYDTSTQIANHCGWHIIDCVKNDKLMSRKDIADLIMREYTNWVENAKT